jgi:neutral ceramidase
MERLLVGIGRSDITPAPGTPQGGWGAQTKQRSVGADLPLYATAMVLQGSGQRVAIVDVDAIGFDAEWTSKILDAICDLSALPRTHVRFSCTHTHSGPNTFRIPLLTEGRDMAIAYLGNLPVQIAGAVWQAMQNMIPVRVAAGKGQCDINVNRRLKLPDGRVVMARNREGVVDRTVRVLRFDDLAERPVATIVHYACHPTTMAWQDQHVTPDYPGMVKKVVEEQIGGACLFLQGATGCIGPRRGFTGDLSVYRRLGKILGLEASKVALNLDTLPREGRLVGVQQSGAPIGIYEDVPREPETPLLVVKSRFVDLPLKQWPAPDQMEADLAPLRQQVEWLRAGGDPEELRAVTARATQLNMRLEMARMHHGKTHVPWQLQGIRIGPVALVAVPGEPFIELSQQIERESPFACTLFSGYTNGGFGYIPAREAYPEGGYEVEISPFSPDAAEIVVRETSAMLNELAAIR